MGQGSLRCGPAFVMGHVGLPKVVTTATSDWRTWKTNSSRMKISSRTAPTIIVSAFLFIKSSWFGSLDIDIQDVRADFVLEVELDHLVSIGREQNVFAGVGRRACE